MQILPRTRWTEDRPVLPIVYLIASDPNVTSSLSSLRVASLHYSVLPVLGTSWFLGTNGNSSGPYGRNHTKIDIDTLLCIYYILQKFHAERIVIACGRDGDTSKKAQLGKNTTFVHEILISDMDYAQKSCCGRVDNLFSYNIVSYSKEFGQKFVPPDCDLSDEAQV